MASNISYFGSLTYQLRREDEQLPSGSFCWDGNKDFSNNFSGMSLTTQVSFMLDQLLGAAYYLKFYGKRCHDEVSAYIDELASIASSSVIPRARHEFGRSTVGKIVDQLELVVKYCKTNLWTDVDIGLIKEFLFSFPGSAYDIMPRVWVDRTGQALVPFLMWMNKEEHPDYMTYTAEGVYAEGGVPIVSCHLSENWPRKNAGDLSMVLRFYGHPIANSFSSTKTSIDIRWQHIAVLGFLSHFNLSACKIETILGVITDFCFHRDIGRSGLSMSHYMAYYISCGVTKAFSLCGDRPGTCVDRPPVSRNIFFEACNNFIAFCRETYAITQVDFEFVKRLFGVFACNKEQKNAVGYLREQDACASAENLRCYQANLTGLEGLELISQNPTRIDALNPVAADEGSSTGSEGDGNTDPVEPTEGDNGSSENPDEGTDSENNDDDTSVEEEPETDEQGDEGDDAPEEPTEDDTGSTDDEGGDSGESTDQSSSADIPDESSDQPSLNLSDKSGIVIEFTKPDDETAETVMFREEINTLISDILSNPPKTMSAQNIATLSALQRFWLWSLRVETIVGILESCVKIPLTTKKLKQRTEY